MQELTVKDVVAMFRATTFNQVVELFKVECLECISYGASRCRTHVAVPCDGYNHLVIKEVIKDLKSRGFDAEEQIQYNVGNFLHISWKYMVEDLPRKGSM
jgi:hypothetical protein